MLMKVSVTRSGCISCAMCWINCPEIFEEEPNDGKSRIAAKFRTAGDIAEGEVPENLRSAAKSAANDCPVSVIHVE